MGRAIDTVLAFSTQGAAAPFPTPLAAASGDSLQVRSFDRASKTYLESVIYSAGGGQRIRVTSPLIHDNVTGLTWEPAEIPSQWILPPEASVRLQPVDTLVVNGGIAAAGTITAGLVIAYENLDGADARLFSWPDIRGLVKYIKPIEVDLNAIAVNAWTDTPINITDKQLHADSYYAVFGWNPNALVDVVGVKGSATGNLRVCGPGATSSLDITEYFITVSEKTGRPHIPVFNANDQGAFNVSAANHAAIAGAAERVYVILAELTKRP